MVTLPLRSEFGEDINLGESPPKVLIQFNRNELPLYIKIDVKHMYDKVSNLPHHPVIYM